jgi:homogentisate 1,2-dioxygenase
MPFYHKLGNLPRVRHTTFYKPDGKSLYREELFSTLGFSGVYSNKYRINMPTAVSKISELSYEKPAIWKDAPLQNYHFCTFRERSKGNFLMSRKAYLANRGCVISTADITENDDSIFYKNTRANEYLFIHHGTGVFHSEYGKIKFEPGDQLIVPKGTIYRLQFDNLESNRLLIVESASAFVIPRHYRNDSGQITENAPYSERDFKLPEYQEPFDEKGDFRILMKAGDRLFEHIVPHHPFDVVGWDGYLYPYGFNIRDYNPKVGRVHLPPPIHLAFRTDDFVLCNFVPRLLDFHPDSIPAPYFHSNIDSDEVIYYAEGNFVSRKGIEEGSVTLHPGGIPHGPQPGKTEESIGAKETKEYAVMIDTFRPLELMENIKGVIDKNYPHSWLT